MVTEVYYFPFHQPTNPSNIIARLCIFGKGLKQKVLSNCSFHCWSIKHSKQNSQGNPLPRCTQPQWPLAILLCPGALRGRRTLRVPAGGGHSSSTSCPPAPARGTDWAQTTAPHSTRPCWAEQSTRPASSLIATALLTHYSAATETCNRKTATTLSRANANLCIQTAGDNKMVCLSTF